MKVKMIKIGINGEGIAYVDRQPVFVTGALPREKVDIDIVKQFPRYRIGKLKRVINPSPLRQIPECGIWYECQSCTLMHAKYGAQLEFKRYILSESLKKYADIEDDMIEEVIPSDNQLDYRNAMKLPIHEEKGKLVVGMYEKDSNQFVKVVNCFIHEKRLDEVKKEVLTILNKYKLYAFSNQSRDGLRYLVIRGLGGQYQCTLISGNIEIPEKCVYEIMAIKGMKSLMQSYNSNKKSVQIFGEHTKLLAGSKYIEFTFKALKIALSPKSFFQLNSGQADKLYTIVEELIPDHQRLIVEAYCGVGIMGMMMAHKADRVIGIEYVPDAVKDAEMNAKMNRLSNVEFICGDAPRGVVNIERKQQIDTLIVDPPRSGLDDIMLDCILKSNIKQIVYISCNPATLGKNLQVLMAKYTVEKIIPIDMFPHTSHVETIVSLRRR